MKSLGIVALLTLIVACATSQAVQLNSTPQRCPAISPDQVRIFTSQSELDKGLRGMLPSRSSSSTAFR